MIPEDFVELLPTEREEVWSQIVQDFQIKVKADPAHFLMTFYQKIVESPHLLFVQALVWALAFVIPGYFITYRLFGMEGPNFSEELSSVTIFHGISHGFSIFLIVFVLQIVLFKLDFKVSPGVFSEILFRSLSQNTSLLLWSIYSVGILTGIFEEIYFRGFLLNSFLIKGMPYQGLVIVSTLFGLLHYGTGTHFLIPIIITGVGFYFGWLYRQTKNIWTTISCHTTYNILGLVMAYLRMDYNNL